MYNQQNIEDSARYHMWHRLGLGSTSTKSRQIYARTIGLKTINQVKPTEEDYKQAMLNMVAYKEPMNSCAKEISKAKLNFVSTFCTPTERIMPKKTEWALYDEAKQEKETTMAYGDLTTTNLETQQRNYLKRRLDEVFYTKKADLRTKFNIDFNASPKTKDELQRKLTAGEFELKTNYFDADGKPNYCYGSMLDAVRWIDPARKEDRDGYDAAKEALNKVFTAAKDVAMMKSLDDGLKALQDFEAATF